ncbi:MAG: hypothetical protein JWN95_643 [Frankiales bacterium]|nr:hypothetical protein [Frankiales bacterium]
MSERAGPQAALPREQRVRSAANASDERSREEPVTR